MKPCPSCGYIVPGAWAECRRCGASLALGEPSPSPAPAAVLAAVPAAPPSDALLPGGPRVNGHPVAPAEMPRVTGPDTWLPRIEPTITVAAPAARARGVNPRAVATVAVVVVCLVAAGFSLTHHGHKTVTTPTVLAPREPFAGIPTSLADVVRIEAESTRHTALAVIISAASPNGAPLTSGQLESLQPGYQWLLGSQASTTNTMISVTSAPGVDVIAVAGTNHDICAFGQWTPAGGASYVTMAHVTNCVATAAPTTGWSPIAGGAAQDLPNDLGN